MNEYDIPILRGGRRIMGLDFSTCGKEIEGCKYYGKPIICGKTMVGDALQQCSKCHEKDVEVGEGVANV